MLAAHGFDWVCVDMEHGSATVADLPGLFQAIRAGGSCPAVRLWAQPEPAAIRRVLDMGAQGLIVADVRMSVEAYQLVQAARRPPQGARGWGYSRSNLWGGAFNAMDVGASVPLIVQIESRQGIENLPVILDVEGVAGAFIGPLDLAGDMGHYGAGQHPEVRAQCMRFVDICAEADKPAGFHVVNPDNFTVKRALLDGYSLVALGTDGVFLNKEAFAALTAAGR
jgi:2-keto-3-deoxy-L-rhamnonate aldolase RhmA